MQKPIVCTTAVVKPIIMTIQFSFYLIVKFILLVVSTLGWGHIVLYSLRKMPPIRDLPNHISHYLAIVLGTGVLGWAILWVGLAGWLYASVGWSLIGVGIIGMVVPTLSVSTGDNAKEKPQILSKRLISNPIQGLFLLLSILASAFPLLNNVFLPPHEWDEIGYHLALAKTYVQHNQIIYVPYMSPSNWPLHTEMLFTLSLLINGELITHLLTWWMTLITAWGLWLIGSNLFNRNTAWFMVAAFLSIPFLIRLSGIGLIEVALPFYGTAALLTYFTYRENDSIGWLLLSGLFCGFAASTKLTGGAYPLLIGLLIVLHLIMSSKNDRPSISRAVRHSMVFGFSVLGTVGPWYLRSYLFTGNPISPFLFSIFGAKDWDLLGNEYHHQILSSWSVELPQSIGGLWQSLYYVVFQPPQLGGYSDGLGVGLLIGAGLGLILTIVNHRFKHIWTLRDVALFTVAYYIIWFFAIAHQVRYLFLILPHLTILLGYVVWYVWQPMPTARYQFAFGLLLVALVTSASPWAKTAKREQVRRNSTVIFNQEARNTFLYEKVKILPAYEYINANLPTDAKYYCFPMNHEAIIWIGTIYGGTHPIKDLFGLNNTIHQAT